MSYGRSNPITWATTPSTGFSFHCQLFLITTIRKVESQAASDHGLPSVGDAVGITHPDDFANCLASKIEEEPLGGILSLPDHAPSRRMPFDPHLS
ncbi:hypothetical protein BSLG_010035 [Batrachochytrium salamandrivorans]|nr:hypothetical protein BSLG_010035 [Batrachochytrium salamandrivorans]